MTKEDQKMVVELLDDELEFLTGINMEENTDLIRAAAACVELLEYIPNREKILRKHAYSIAISESSKKNHTLS